MSIEHLVSIIIPAYNCEHSTGQCIASALSQTVAPKEIIGINDGSTDGTGEFLRGMGSDIRLIEQENKGQGAARNAGIDVAQGTYITFLDADD